MLTGCASTEFNRASFIEEMRQTDFYEKASGDKAGKSQEEYNALALECWKKAIRKLPPTFSKQQLKEIEPVYKLCLALEMSSSAIVSKEEFLDASFTMDHYDRYLNEIDVGLSRLEVNTIVKNCYEQGIDSLPTVFSIDQFNAFEPFIDLCVNSKLDEVVKLPKEPFFENLRAKIVLNEDHELNAFFDMTNIDRQEFNVIVIDCLRLQMKSLPDMFNIKELEETNLIWKECFENKLKPFMKD